VNEVTYRGDDDKCGGCGSDPCTNSGPGCPGGGPKLRFGRIASIMVAVGLGIAALASCATDAQKVSENLSKDADQFNVVRKIVLTNTWNGETLWEATGRCSIDIGRPDVLVLICLEDQAVGLYKKHYLSTGGGNISWASTQLDAAPASRYHTTIVFKPTAIVPNIDISVGQK
jgi:hypothetical protein